MQKRADFTLVELLVVVGIIAILAGLVLPAVRMIQQRGRITAAKSDMTAILMALKGVESNYEKMVKGGASCSFNGKSPTVDSTNHIVTLGGGNGTSEEAYDAFIAELTVPAKVSSPNVNKRKMKLLDPKPDFDASAAYNTADNLLKLWRDPWGNRYKILINYNGEDSIPNPADTSKKLAAKAVVYSYGPNGTDDSARNIEVDVGSPTKLHDDIASWHK